VSKLNRDLNPNLNRETIPIDIDINIEIKSVSGAWKRGKNRRGRGGHGWQKSTTDMA
jgi:hypothetical protein